MNDDMMVDEALADAAGSKNVKEVLDALEKESTAPAAAEVPTSKVKGFLNTLSSNLLGTANNVLKSDTTAQYIRMMKQVSTEEIHRKLAAVILSQWWSAIDRVAEPYKDNKLISGLLFTKTGRTLIVSAVSVTASSLALGIAAQMEERGTDEGKLNARLLRAVSKTFAYITLEQIGEVVNVDKWLDILVDKVKEMCNKAGVKPEDLAESV